MRKTTLSNFIKQVTALYPRTTNLAVSYNTAKNDGINTTTFYRVSALSIPTTLTDDAIIATWSNGKGTIK